MATAEGTLVARNSRGKRVIAEATIPNDLLTFMMGVDAQTLFKARLVN